MGRLDAQGKAFESFANAAYEDRCTIRRRVSTKVGLDTTYSPQIVATSVPCRLSPSSAQERQIAGATQGSVAYTVRMPALIAGSSIQLDSKCYLEIAAREGSEAQTLNVIAPLRSSGGVLDTVAERPA